jgi:hypothetical protein
VIFIAVTSAAALGFQPLCEIQHVLPFVLRRAVIAVIVQMRFVINRFQHLIQQFTGMAFAVRMRFDAVDELQNSRKGRS